MNSENESGEHSPPWRGELRAALSVIESLHHDAIADAAVPGSDTAALDELGRRWARARHPLAALLLASERLTRQTVSKMISSSPDIGDVSRLAEKAHSTGAAVNRVLLAAFQDEHRGNSGAPDDGDRQLVAAGLLWGAPVPVELTRTGATSFAVMAVHSGDPGDLRARIDGALAACGRLDVVHLLCGGSGYLLAPARGERQAEELCRQLYDHLRGEVRLAVAWGGRGEVECGRAEASTVLDLATGLRRAPGVYRVEDVVLEYAVMQDKAAMASLLSLVRPVVDQQVLRGALEALIAASGNRSKAATVLKIHRSTLEYRLDRVDQLTGCPPTTARGLQMLAAALTVHEVLHNERPASW